MKTITLNLSKEDADTLIGSLEIARSCIIRKTPNPYTAPSKPIKNLTRIIDIIKKQVD